MNLYTPTMMEFCRVANLALKCTPRAKWGEVFVALYLQFCRQYSRGTTSSSHGVEFFDNVLAGPENWKEPGEYGDNFRKLAKNV